MNEQFLARSLATEQAEACTPTVSVRFKGRKN